jgi:16S rRNA (adenine1518-N6/adenine1519-N6)-dimethyltransferase
MTERFLHKKSLGQHFLNSDYVPKKMCDAAELAPREIVFEIGPGTGILTKELLARGVFVVALEADLRAIEVLKTDFAIDITKGTLVIHHGDARELNLSSLGLIDQKFKVVSNIPYYLSGLLFRQLLESTIQPSLLVFLIQKELAERITRDRKESLLSLSIEAFGNPSYICTVKRGHFNPPPRIDSAIVKISNINKGFFTNFTEEQFFTILHEAFKSKRKQLVGNLSGMFKREGVLILLSQIGLNPDVRAEDISLPQWQTLVIQLLSANFPQK